MSTSNPSRVPVSQKLRLLVLASRPLSWVNTAFPFAAAAFLTSGQINAFFLLGTFFFLFPYNLLMYGVNDVFDYESDINNPRKGGVEGALLPKSVHKFILATAYLLTILFGGLMVWAGPANPWSWVALGISVFAVLAYSLPPLRTKERPVLDSMTSSTHFVSPAIYGLIAGGAVFTWELTLLLVAFFLWGMAAHSFGAVQDVVPDRAGGLRSIATELGAGNTVWFAIVMWIGAGASMWIASVLSLVTRGDVQGGFTFAIAAALVLPYLVAVWPYRGVSDARSGETNRAWKKFLAINFFVGFAVTMLLIAWRLF